MIYIVEDDSSIRELEQYALQSNGYDARGCEDAASFGLHCAIPGPSWSFWTSCCLTRTATRF